MGLFSIFFEMLSPTRAMIPIALAIDPSPKRPQAERGQEATLAATAFDNVSASA